MNWDFNTVTKSFRGIVTDMTQAPVKEETIQFTMKTLVDNPTVHQALNHIVVPTVVEKKNFERTHSDVTTQLERQSTDTGDIYSLKVWSKPICETCNEVIKNPTLTKQEVVINGFKTGMMVKRIEGLPLPVVTCLAFKPDSNNSITEEIILVDLNMPQPVCRLLSDRKTRMMQQLNPPQKIEPSLPPLSTRVSEQTKQHAVLQKAQQTQKIPTADSPADQPKTSRVALNRSILWTPHVGFPVTASSKTTRKPSPTQLPPVGTGSRPSVSDCLPKPTMGFPSNQVNAVPQISTPGLGIAKKVSEALAQRSSAPQIPIPVQTNAPASQKGANSDSLSPPAPLTDLHTIPQFRDVDNQFLAINNLVQSLLAEKVNPAPLLRDFDDACSNLKDALNMMPSNMPGHKNRRDTLSEYRKWGWNWNKHTLDVQLKIVVAQDFGDETTPFKDIDKQLKELHSNIEDLYDMTGAQGLNFLYEEDPCVTGQLALLKTSLAQIDNATEGYEARKKFSEEFDRRIKDWLQQSGGD